MLILQMKTRNSGQINVLVYGEHPLDIFGEPAA